MDNRKYTRLNIDVMAEIDLANGGRLYGETADLSLDGAFINLSPPRELAAGEHCKVRLILNASENWVKTEFQSSIAHIKEDGIGVRFEQASITHHEAYLKLLVNGADDVDVLLEELSNHPRADFGFTR